MELSTYCGPTTLWVLTRAGARARRPWCPIGGSPRWPWWIDGELQEAVDSPDLAEITTAARRLRDSLLTDGWVQLDGDASPPDSSRPPRFRAPGFELAPGQGIPPTPSFAARGGDDSHSGLGA
jgi:hypothetical protein